MNSISANLNAWYNLSMNTNLENLKIENPKTNWGGTRAGSGRKPKLQFEAREQFNLFVDDNIDILHDCALRHVKKGNFRALEYLFDQRYGKAPLNVETTNKSLNLNVSDQKIIPNPELIELANRISAELKIMKTKSI